MTEITKNLEEKIDYIYQQTQKNQRSAKIWSIFKWIYRLIIVLYLWYFFFISLPNMVEKFTSFESMSDNMKISEILENPQFREIYNTYFSQQ